MHRTIVDTKFPYVLVCSTLGAILGLASVWLITALTMLPWSSLKEHAHDAHDG